MSRTLPFDPARATPGAVGLFTRFVDGARCAVGGFGVVLREPRLRLVAAAPIAVHAALFVVLLVGGITLVADPVGDALARGTTGARDVVGATLGDALAAVARGAGWLLVLLGSFVGTLVVGNVVCDPFHDVLSERTEELLLGRVVGEPLTVAGVLGGIAREAGASVVGLLVWAAVALPLWLLSLTPAVIVAAPASLAWTWLFAAREFLARPLARHTVHVGGRLGALFGHKALFLGFGGAATLLAAVPFTAPFLVVGATRAYLALAARGAVPSRLTDDDRRALQACFAP